MHQFKAWRAGRLHMPAQSACMEDGQLQSSDGKQWVHSIQGASCFAPWCTPSQLPRTAMNGLRRRSRPPRCGNTGGCAQCQRSAVRNMSLHMLAAASSKQQCRTAMT